MTSSLSPNSIQQKFDQLAIAASLDGRSEKAKAQAVNPTKSLLSKSLAGETHKQNHQPPEVMSYHDYTVRMDDHPEPSLLATSVGRDGDGRLIPSSSNISLLSLSNNACNTPNNQPLMGSSTSLSNPPFGTSDLYLQGSKFVIGVPGQAVPERVNSYTNLRSRHSITHMSQRRLQPYHKMYLPTVPGTSEFNAVSSPKVIPNRNHALIPESPNLDPTSLHGSPSRFWLSSQTPPVSLPNSFIKTRDLNLANSFPHSTAPIYLVNQDRDRSSHVVSANINIVSCGGDSPILNPVQTPTGDLPMTPLYLNSDHDSYFVLAKPHSGFQLNHEQYSDILESSDDIFMKGSSEDDETI